MGFKTLTKHLGKVLRDQKTFLLSELFELCQDKISDHKFFQDLLDNKDVITKNYFVMNLVPPNISLNVVKEVDFVLNNFKPEFNKTDFIKMMVADRFFFERGIFK